MIKNTIYLISCITIILSGCSGSIVRLGDTYNWNAVKPPRENILGRGVYENGKFGEQIIPITKNNVRVSKSYSNFTSEDYKNLTTGLNIVIKDISAKAGYETTSSMTSTSTGLEISEIIDFTKEIIINKKFVIKCLTAEKYEFSIIQNNKTNVSLDFTKIADKLGVLSSDIAIQKNPEKPNVFNVSVSNNNTCLSYLSAIFKPNGELPLFSGNINKVSIFIYGVNGNELNSINYELERGQTSHFNTPQFIGIEPSDKPEYRIQATNNSNNKLILSICRQGNGLVDRKYWCKKIEDNGFGKWDRTYYVDTFEYNDRLFKSISININAERSKNNGKIKVKYAKLRYPQYKLIIE